MRAVEFSAHPCLEEFKVELTVRGKVSWFSISCKTFEITLFAPFGCHPNVVKSFAEHLASPLLSIIYEEEAAAHDREEEHEIIAPDRVDVSFSDPNETSDPNEPPPL